LRLATRLVLYKVLKSFGRKGGPVSGTGLYKCDVVVFAVTAAGYYGIIDLVGKRGVILQHGNSTRRQKGPKMVGAVRSVKSQSRHEAFRKAKGCCFAYCKEDKETKKLLSGVELSGCDQCTTSRVKRAT